METDVETPALAPSQADASDASGAPEGPGAPAAPNAPDAEPAAHPHSRGWRRWLLRGFILSLLLAGAAAVAVTAVAIVDERGGPAGRTAVNGVVMPDDTRFRDIARQLLARERPEKLGGMTVVGAEGKVTVIRHRAGRPSFLSSYLNPNALRLIARAIGGRSDAMVTVEELRLEVRRATGRQRWRLRGTQAGAPWRATIAPNGTNLRLIPTKKS